MQDVRGRRDGVRAEEHRQARKLARHDAAPCQRRVPVHVGVFARCQRGWLHLVVGFEDLGRLAEVVAGLEGCGVGVDDLLAAPELRVDELERRLDRPRVHPRDQTEREEVLGAFCITRLDAVLGHGVPGDLAHRHRVRAVVVQGAVIERIAGVAGLLQVAVVEGIGVQDQRAALREVVQLRLQRRRIHCHQHCRCITRGGDVKIGDAHLEGRDTGQRSLRGADLGGELGQRGQIVAECRGDARELVTGELHAVAGVAGEADDDLVDLLQRQFARCGIGHCVS